MTGFQTQSEIQALLAAHGLRPQRRHGQHFLIDRNLMHRLIDTAQVAPSDNIIEVGAGTGSLTGMLAARCAHVHSFEIDRHIWPIARSQLSHHANITIHTTDALRSKNALCETLAKLVAVEPPAGTAVKLVANLPYDVATPLLMELLLAPAPPSDMCFTIQREVGLRMIAPVGTRDYGPVSVLCKLFALIERVANVPPGAFWPQPKVDSVMLRLTPDPAAPAAAHKHHVAALVRRVFQHRRKSVGNILRGWQPPNVVTSALASAGVDPAARPESISPDQWISLARGLSA